MHLLSEEEIKQATELLSYKEKRTIAELSREEILLGLQYVVYTKDQYLHDWLEHIEYDLIDRWKENNFFEYDSKTMLFQLSKSRTFNQIVYDIRDELNENMNKVKWGKNIENFIPYGLEMLFNKQSPISSMKILEHFVDDNLCFIKTHIEFPHKSYKRYDSRRKTSETREFVIERWGKFNENYKTKQKKYQKQFKELKQKKTAPKARVIDTKIQKVIKPQYVDTTLYEIKKDEENNSFINLFESCQILSSVVLKVVIRPWVVKSDGDKVWIRYREDIYTNKGEFESSRVKKDLYFIINEFGGIEETKDFPFKDESVLEAHARIENDPCQPVILESPKSTSDVYLRVSEDESEILEYISYEHIDFELTKATFEAREYQITNNVDSTLFKTKQFFALYEGRWIESTSRNHKVKEMLDTYALADKLIEE